MRRNLFNIFQKRCDGHLVKVYLDPSLQTYCYAVSVDGEDCGEAVYCEGDNPGDDPYFDFYYQGQRIKMKVGYCCPSDSPREVDDTITGIRYCLKRYKNFAKEVFLSLNGKNEIVKIFSEEEQAKKFGSSYKKVLMDFRVVEEKDIEREIKVWNEDFDEEPMKLSEFLNEIINVWL